MFFMELKGRPTEKLQKDARTKSSKNRMQTASTSRLWQVTAALKDLKDLKDEYARRLMRLVVERRAVWLWADCHVDVHVNVFFSSQAHILVLQQRHELNRNQSSSFIPRLYRKGMNSAGFHNLPEGSRMTLH